MKNWTIFAGIAGLVAISLGVWLFRPAPVQETPVVETGYQVGDRLPPAAEAGKTGSREIGWEDLIPAGWIPEELLASLNLDELEEVDDGDPQAQEALKRILEEWDRAPVVEEFDGQLVRIPGFVVPLEGDGKTINEFLLVPYFGACVHVPPPPSNQLIHVVPNQPIPGEWDMTPVWVAGELAVVRFDSSLGSAGYQLRALTVEEYAEIQPD